MVSYVIVNYSQVNMREELSSNVCDFLVLRVIFNGIFVAVRFTLAKLHVVNSDAIIGQGFSMNISDSLANLEESLILIDSRLILSKIIKENSSTIVGSALVS
jgi:hypothetical protein